MILANAFESPKIIWYSESRPASGATQNLHLLLQQSYQNRSSSALDWAPSITASLREIAGSCSAANWDGENAQAISGKVIAIAESVVWSLIAILPKGTPSPEILPERDGEICLSWGLNDGRIFSFSLGEHGKMNYAGQLGKKGAVHGWQPIDVSNPWSLRADLQEVARHIVKLYQ